MTCALAAAARIRRRRQRVGFDLRRRLGAAPACALEQMGRSGLMFSGVGIGIAATGLLCLWLVARRATVATAWMIWAVMAIALSVFVWAALTQDGGR